MNPVDRGIALVRPPTADLSEGIVTHIARVPLDVDLAQEQHAAYCAALAGAGWTVHAVEAAPGCPDAVFIEDTVVVVDQTAVLTRPGAHSRRDEVQGVEDAVRELGLDLRHIEASATLDGGDVLQVGDRVYVGRGGRTNAEGIRQLRALLPPGRTVVPVQLTSVLHLKSAVTALPDGTFLALPELLEAGVFPPGRPVTSYPSTRSGCSSALRPQGAPTDSRTSASSRSWWTSASSKSSKAASPVSAS